MSREDHKKYFEILELNPDASMLEIKNAYIRLKKLYSSDSIVISPIADEFSEKMRQEILHQIEEAYTKLKILLKNERSKSIYHEKPLVSGEGAQGKEMDSISYSGHVLRQIRKEKGIHLYEIALDTKIRIELLNNIELEKFDALPPEAYLKGHISNYASFLLLNPKKVADDYISRYKAWKMKIKENA